MFLYLIRMVFTMLADPLETFTIYHVVILTIVLSHFPKEPLGGFDLFVGYMGMPVNDDVDVLLDGSFYDSFHEAFLFFRL